jgi:hypothetical protein
MKFGLYERRTAPRIQGTLAPHGTSRFRVNPAVILARIERSAALRSLIAATYRIKRASANRAQRRFSEINAYEATVYSQSGEDGIIRELFARLPTAQRFFVEFGVEDGAICNTRLLIEQYHWEGVMIECDPDAFALLCRRYEPHPVQCVQSFITRENIGGLFERAQVPEDFGLLSIDIDGNDYWIWEALAAYRPAVVLIEYNGTFGKDKRIVQAYDAAHRWNGRSRGYGASLAALAELGNRLGYSLIGTVRRGINAFFVRSDLLSAIGFPARNVAQAFHPHGTYQRFYPLGSTVLIEN